MRDEAVIALMLVLVIASAGAGYYVGNSSKQTVTSTETSLPTSTTTEIPSANETCGHPLYPWLNSSPGILSNVMLIPPNSTGLVCVTYNVDPQQAQTYQQYIWSGETIDLLGGQGVPPVARGVNVTTISAVITQSNETVEYQMQTSGNSTGAYTWWTFGKCPGFPLVVGSNASSAEPVLKQYYSGNFYCPAFDSGAILDGLSGISVVNVPI